MKTFFLKNWIPILGLFNLVSWFLIHFLAQFEIEGDQLGIWIQWIIVLIIIDIIFIFLVLFLKKS